MKYKIFFTVFTPGIEGFTHTRIFNGTFEEAARRAETAKRLFARIGSETFYRITEASKIDSSSQNNEQTMRFFP